MVVAERRSIIGVTLCGRALRSLIAKEKFESVSKGSTESGIAESAVRLPSSLIRFDVGGSVKSILKLS